MVAYKAEDVLGVVVIQNIQQIQNELKFADIFKFKNSQIITESLSTVDGHVLCVSRVLCRHDLDRVASHLFSLFCWWASSVIWRREWGWAPLRCCHISTPASRAPPPPPNDASLCTPQLPTLPLISCALYFCTVYSEVLVFIESSLNCSMNISSR